MTKAVELTFKNGGNANAGPFRVSAMKGFAEFDQWVYQGLSQGATQVQTLSTSSMPPGTYIVRMVLDSYIAVNESNENNNGRDVTITKSPDGTVTVN
jgi:subtilase family serine protease